VPGHSLQGTQIHEVVEGLSGDSIPFVLRRDHGLVIGIVFVVDPG
jgi:hypothetical protein